MWAGAGRCSANRNACPSITSVYINSLLGNLYLFWSFINDTDISTIDGVMHFRILLGNYLLLT